MKYDPENRKHREDLASRLEGVFLGAKFTKRKSVGEDVYFYPINDNGTLKILVYSSIVGNEVRGNGKDAIRVALVYENKDGCEKGLARETRINRTGTVDDIAARVLDRMREAYKKSRHLDCCQRCGSPKFISKKGNSVCAELCWRN